MAYINTQTEQKIIREFKITHGKECYYCHTKITRDDKLTVDHKLPKSRGGLTTDENLEICCEDCNLEKSDMTEQEYIDYLKKKDNIINSNETLKTIVDMIQSNENIILKYEESTKLLSEKLKEKIEIEKCITDIKFNASEGYMLCKDMQKVLTEINSVNKESTMLQKLSNLARSQRDKLKNTYNELTKDIMRDIRNEMGIGKLGVK